MKYVCNSFLAHNGMINVNVQIYFSHFLVINAILNLIIIVIIIIIIIIIIIDVI
jgi:hypothetical protein